MVAGEATKRHEKNQGTFGCIVNAPNSSLFFLCLDQAERAQMLHPALAL